MNVSRLAGWLKVPEIRHPKSDIPSTGRLVSLDAFRGAIIALMVLVNDPGDGRHVYAPLQHADWNGWTIPHLVFPSFVSIVGDAMTFSMARPTCPRLSLHQ